MKVTKERLMKSGWRQCAVGQRVTQFCPHAEAFAHERDYWHKKTIITETMLARCINAITNEFSLISPKAETLMSDIVSQWESAVGELDAEYLEVENKDTKEGSCNG